MQLLDFAIFRHSRPSQNIREPRENPLNSSLTPPSDSISIPDRLKCTCYFCLFRPLLWAWIKESTDHAFLYQELTIYCYYHRIVSVCENEYLDHETKKCKVHGTCVASLCHFIKSTKRGFWTDGVYTIDFKDLNNQPDYKKIKLRWLSKNLPSNGYE